VEFIGIRAGEKLREDLISADEARSTVDAGDFYVVRPSADWWPADGWAEASPVDENFHYRSDLNDRWLSVDEIRDTVFAATAPGLVS
jgi:UDP-N-acetylglucosamine 4,6-dehydratase